MIAIIYYLTGDGLGSAKPFSLSIFSRAAVRLQLGLSWGDTRWPSSDVSGRSLHVTRQHGRIRAARILTQRLRQRGIGPGGLYHLSWVSLKVTWHHFFPILSARSKSLRPTHVQGKRKSSTYFDVRVPKNMTCFKTTISDKIEICKSMNVIPLKAKEGVVWLDPQYLDMIATGISSYLNVS